MLEKSMGISALMIALVTGNVIWGGTAVRAEEPNQVFTLDPMVVTATRTEKRDVDVPASTTILTSEDLKATGAQNLQVALGRVPGLVYKTFAPGGGAMGTMANEIAIRGVSNGTLIMLNGSPMNLRGKYFLDAIPIDSIEKVEIVKGGGSVLYGSEAMGGVINIITKHVSQTFSRNWNCCIVFLIGFNFFQRKIKHCFHSFIVKINKKPALVITRTG